MSLSTVLHIRGGIEDDSKIFFLFPTTIPRCMGVACLCNTFLFRCFFLSLRHDVYICMLHCLYSYVTLVVISVNKDEN